MCFFCNVNQEDEVGFYEPFVFLILWTVRYSLLVNLSSLDLAVVLLVISLSLVVALALALLKACSSSW